MSLISCYARRFSRTRPPRCLPSSRWDITGLASTASRRHFHDGGLTLAIEEELAEHEKLKGRIDKKNWDEYKTSFEITPPNSPPNFEFKRCIPSSLIGTRVTAVGFLGKVKNMGAGMSFVQLEGGSGPEQIQILARAEFNDEARRMLRQIKPNSAVSLTGALHWKYEAKDWVNDELPDEGTEFISNLEIRLVSIKVLNTFSRPFHPGSMLDPKERDLHIRFDRELRQRLKFRSDVASFARLELADFQEIETPILFKSTPEGAREFLVPTRNRGMAYGLPQSPQQYKQILMASGISRYVQFAKCFRDEDHRADRQPEFTQIDLEMAWANGEQVMQRVEQFVKALWTKFAGQGTLQLPLPETPFIRMTYDEAMSKHGSDKPDLRIPGEIQRIDQIVPADLRGMLTSIEDPILETFKIRLDGDSKAAQRLIREFMDSPDAEPFKRNVDGAPGIFIYDPRRPIEGLQAFGFEGAESLKAMYTEEDALGDGDLLLVQARPKLPHSGGATMIGKLRLAIYKAALAKRLVDADSAHHFLWITDFPMFTPDNASDPGQGGSSGFSATHHPFTAPKTSDDLDLLLTNPLNAKADHYDLVLNGVELGGGSRRIHSSAIQKFIMKDIIKMPQSRMDDFKHLFRALEAGCPPHAGLAIGFDRLIAVMQGRDTVRDVIAFPKNSNGEDPMVESPGSMHQKQLEAYHLSIVSPKEQQHEKAWYEPRENRSATLRSLANDESYMEEYMDLIKVLPINRSDPTIKSFTPAQKNHMKDYIEHIQTLPGEDTDLVPWSQKPKSMIFIGSPDNTAETRQQIAKVVEQLNQGQSTAAVMVDGDNLRSFATKVTSPSFGFLWKNPDFVLGGAMPPQETFGSFGESASVVSKLAKETTAEERRNKTMWGLPSDKSRGPSHPVKTGGKKG